MPFGFFHWCLGAPDLGLPELCPRVPSDQGLDPPRLGRSERSAYPPPDLPPGLYLPFGFQGTPWLLGFALGLQGLLPPRSASRPSRESPDFTSRERLSALL